MARAGERMKQHGLHISRYGVERHGVLDTVLGHGEASGAEGVGLDHVGARRKVGAVDLADHVGAREAQDVVVAQQRTGVGGKGVALEVGFSQAVSLDHGAHGAVQDEDAFVEEARDSVRAFRGRLAADLHFVPCSHLHSIPCSHLHVVLGHILVCAV